MSDKSKKSNATKNVTKLAKYSPDQIKQMEKEASKSGLSGKALENAVKDKISGKTNDTSLGHGKGSSGSGQNNKTSGLLKAAKK